MPFCPECHAEYREGFTRCASCDVELVAELPTGLDLSAEGVAEALAGQELVPVAGGQFEVLKEMRENLAARRIASLIVEDPEHQNPPGMPKRVLLAVGKADVAAARDALEADFNAMIAEEGMAGETEMRYGQCPACGCQLTEDQDECPECGLYIGEG